MRRRRDRPRVDCFASTPSAAAAARCSLFLTLLSRSALQAVTVPGSCEMRMLKPPLVDTECPSCCRPPFSDSAFLITTRHSWLMRSRRSTIRMPCGLDLKKLARWFCRCPARPGPSKKPPSMCFVCLECAADEIACSAAVHSFLFAQATATVSDFCLVALPAASYTSSRVSLLQGASALANACGVRRSRKEEGGCVAWLLATAGACMLAASCSILVESGASRASTRETTLFKPAPKERLDDWHASTSDPALGATAGYACIIFPKSWQLSRGSSCNTPPTFGSPPCNCAPHSCRSSTSPPNKSTVKKIGMRVASHQKGLLPRLRERGRKGTWLGPGCGVD
mmetsp:Transcript_12685/g.34619  ORF Transcript_12685/g.34619 Transcript_12685/m.34619 type:complete len:339 (+) Transcript_12685:486-1502(+)